MKLSLLVFRCHEGYEMSIVLTTENSSPCLRAKLKPSSFLHSSRLIASSLVSFIVAYFDRLLYLLLYISTLFIFSLSIPLLIFLQVRHYAINAQTVFSFCYLLYLKDLSLPQLCSFDIFSILLYFLYWPPHFITILIFLWFSL